MTNAQARVGTTQFCSHTTDGSICDQCMGLRAQPPATGLARYAPITGFDWVGNPTFAEMVKVGNSNSAYYLAADVEAVLAELRRALELLVIDYENIEAPYRQLWGSEFAQPQALTNAKRVLAQLRGGGA